MFVLVPHRRSLPAFGLVVLTVSILLLLGLLLPPGSMPIRDQAAAVGAPDLPTLPLAFVPNQGQTDPVVQFQAQSMGGTVFFTPHEVVVALPSAAAEQPAPTVRLSFLDANPTPTITPDTPLPGRVNDLRGDDPTQWRTDIPTYAGIVYHDVYAGIDLRYDGHASTLKGTYTVAPGVDPQQIRWRYQGVEQVRIDQASGNLQVTVAADRVLTEAAPVAWQDIAGQRVPVHARYQVAADGTISFAVGAYNPAYPLIIDPTIAWSTYLGGEGNDPALDIAVDGVGNTYVVGFTNSPNFPVTRDTYDATFNTLFDAYVAKMSTDGRTLVYATYLGGTGIDQGWSIAVDAAGQAYVSGRTDSTDFPTTPGAFDRTLGDGSGCEDLIDCDDAFVAKLSAGGNALLYATYLGGNSSELGIVGPHVAVDTDGNAYVTGRTRSSDFPTTPGAFDRTLELDPFSNVGADVFVTKVNPLGTALVYSTFLGGPTDAEEGRDIAVDAAGNAYVTGLTNGDFPIKDAVQPTTDGSQDLFITKVNAQGSALVYSTYLGGNDFDYPGSIAVDGAGNTYVSGHTFSPNFPTKNALQPRCKRCDPSDDGYDAVVAKLNAQGNTLVYATYLGGTEGDDAFGLAVDRAGTVYVAGNTMSPDFPLQNPLQGDAGGFDGYVAKLSTDGRALVYSTYLGGSDGDLVRALALDSAGNAYIAGETFSTDFPTNTPLQPSNAGFSDAFVVKLRDPAQAPRVYLPMIRR